MLIVDSTKWMSKAIELEYGNITHRSSHYPRTQPMVALFGDVLSEPRGIQKLNRQLI